MKQPKHNTKTFRIDKEADEQLKELYISRLQTEVRVTRSSIINEAIKLLYAQENE